MRRACQILMVLMLAAGCDTDGQKREEKKTERDPVTGLTAAEAADVLARVGDRTITLGQYVASLQRMDRFERARYQSEEGQKELLDEMIEVEILAQEALRRGLDKDPEVQQRLQQALRDELLLDLEKQLPKAEDLPEREVREYYEAHRPEFKEPRRLRAMVIVIGDPQLAQRVAKEAQGASGEKWGELAKKYSLLRKGLDENAAPELAGDLGFVSAPGEKRGRNTEVPEPVRAALFDLAKIGDVVSTPIEHNRRYYIVRLAGISAARDRSLADAERTIRSELRRQRFVEAEKKLEAELRKKYPVVLDEAALAQRAAALQVDGAPTSDAKTGETETPSP